MAVKHDRRANRPGRDENALMRTSMFRNAFGGNTAKTRDIAAGNNKRKSRMFLGKPSQAVK